jgi:putative transposase
MSFLAKSRNPKYRKRILIGKVSERTRDLLRQICMEHEV